MSTRAASTRETVETMYRALATGDWAGFTQALSDEIVIEEPQFLPYGGTYVGRAGLRTLAPRIGAALDMSTLRIEHMLVEADRAFTVLRVQMTTGGGWLRAAEETVVRDGKVTEWRIYLLDDGSCADRVGSRQTDDDYRR